MKNDEGWLSCGRAFICQYFEERKTQMAAYTEVRQALFGRQALLKEMQAGMEADVAA
ncbi:MAG: hypothetical protein ACI4OD_09050 [Selenomonas sp.]